jgi:hypothetical protein
MAEYGLIVGRVAVLGVAVEVRWYGYLPYSGNDAAECHLRGIP